MQIVVILVLDGDLGGGALDDDQPRNGRERARVPGDVLEELLAGKKHGGVVALDGPTCGDAKVAGEEFFLGVFYGEMGLGEEAQAEADGGVFKVRSGWHTLHTHISLLSREPKAERFLLGRERKRGGGGE